MPAMTPIEILWILAHVMWALGALVYLFDGYRSFILGREGFVTNTTPEIPDVQREMDARKLSAPPLIKFQITTRGRETHVVIRGIASAIRCQEHVPWKNRVMVDVVTEDPKDVEEINAAFPNPAVPLRVLLVPKDYKTPRGTRLKARALHYSTEWRKTLVEERGFVIHFDAESAMEPVDFVRLLFNLVRADGKMKLCEGPILYPLEWGKSNTVSRQLESNRIFDCFHCHLLMENPPPYHLHGSNLVVEEELLMELGWDLGLSRGKALVAEDLLFGMRAFALKGKSIFGWSGAAILEQPPFTVKDSVRQRIRWVTGVWQAMDVIGRDPEYRKIPRREMRRLKAIVVARLSVYGMGFFAGLFSIILAAFAISDATMGTRIAASIPQAWRDFSMLLIPGLFLWLGTSQIGLYKNLQRMSLPAHRRAYEHLKVLVVTPVGAIVETGAALYATLTWWIGGNQVHWVPTPK
jgi:hypothetical protein